MNSTDANAGRVWNLDEILAYLETWGGSFVVKGGALCVVFPRALANAKAVSETVLPHLTARKSEILDYLNENYPGAFSSNVQVEQKTAESERARIVRETIREARDKGKAVYFLKRSGAAVGSDFPAVKKRYTRPFKREVEVPIEREATHVCIEGEVWRPLPKVTTREEDEAVRPTKNAPWFARRQREETHSYLEDDS